MVGDVLGDARSLHPPFQRCLRHAVLEAAEDYPLPYPVVNQCQCLFSYRVVDNLVGLLHAVGDVERAVGFGLYQLPLERLDIALPQSREAGEEEGGPQDGHIAGGLRQLDEFYLLGIPYHLYK